MGADRGDKKMQAFVTDIKPSQCWGYLLPKHKEIIFENNLNPVMLVFIGLLSPSTLKWVTTWQGINLSAFYHTYVLAKLATISIQVNPSNVEATFVLSTRTQRFWKTSKPCHVGIHWIALLEYFHMSTHLPGFSVIFQVICIILYWLN